jgi:hypothetical protein
MERNRRTNMRRALIGLIVAASLASPAMAQVNLSLGYSAPGVSIGINVPVYPRLAAIPGYPVYYAPSLPANYFFYDGLYWVFDGNGWYQSSWYNGPWAAVDPYAVPVYLLQVPVRYYHRPPAYFRGWSVNAAPHWNEHWGRAWSDRRAGWDHRADRGYAAAPLPSYQRHYSGTRYPTQQQQAAIQDRSYRYQPRDSQVQQHWQHNAHVAAGVPQHEPRGQPREERRKQPPVDRGHQIPEYSKDHGEHSGG